MWISGLYDPARVRQFYPPSVPQGLEKLLEALQNSKAPALVLGSGTGDLGFTVAPRLAEALNAPVFTESFTVVAAFPNRHPLYRGALPPAAPAIAGILDPFDLVLVLGAAAFTVYPYLPGDLVGEQTQVYQVSDDPDELGRSPASAVFMGDPGLALQWLAERVTPRGTAVESSPWPELPAPSGAGLAVQTALPWLLNQLPPDAVLVDEGVTASPILQKHFPVTVPRSYFRGSSVLVSGKAGTGKTSLAAHFAAEAGHRPGPEIASGRPRGRDGGAVGRRADDRPVQHQHTNAQSVTQPGRVCTDLRIVVRVA